MTDISACNVSRRKGVGASIGRGRSQSKRRSCSKKREAVVADATFKDGQDGDVLLDFSLPLILLGLLFSDRFLLRVLSF